VLRFQQTGARTQHVNCPYSGCALSACAAQNDLTARAGEALSTESVLVGCIGSAFAAAWRMRTCNLAQISCSAMRHALKGVRTSLTRAYSALAAGSLLRGGATWRQACCWLGERGTMLSQAAGVWGASFWRTEHCFVRPWHALVHWHCHVVDWMNWAGCNEATGLK
jgi:hypothetical protein